MATSSEIKQRANALAEKTDVNSITPREVGGIMYDLASHSENVLRNGGTLGIRKVYESVAAMEADSTNPKDLWGEPLKKGNLVVIYDGTSTGVDNNKIYAFLKPGWQIATHLDAGYATKASLDAAIENVLIQFRYSENALKESIGNLEETVTGNKQEVDAKLSELGYELSKTGSVTYKGTTEARTGGSFVVIDNAICPKGSTIEILVYGSAVTSNFIICGEGGTDDIIKNYAEMNTPYEVVLDKDVNQIKLYLRSISVQGDISVSVRVKGLNDRVDEIERRIESNEDGVFVNFDLINFKEVIRTIDNWNQSNKSISVISDLHIIKGTELELSVVGDAVADTYRITNQEGTSETLVTTNERNKKVIVTLERDLYELKLWTSSVSTVGALGVSVRIIAQKNEQLEDIENEITKTKELVDKQAAESKAVNSLQGVSFDSNVITPDHVKNAIKSVWFSCPTAGNIEKVLANVNEVYIRAINNKPAGYSPAIYISSEDKADLFLWFLKSQTEPRTGVETIQLTINSSFSSQFGLSGYSPIINIVVDWDAFGQNIREDSTGVKIELSKIWRFQRENVTVVESAKSGVANSLVGKTIVCFGDSLTEMTDSTNSLHYSDYISYMTGANVINCGVGGSQLRQRTTPSTTPRDGSQAYAALDIINMIRAACNKDFSMQTAANEYLITNASDDNSLAINNLKTIDWGKVDAVTIFAGTNDWYTPNTIGGSGSNDVNYTLGAINEIIRLVSSTYPHIKMLFFTPVVRWLDYSETNGVGTSANWSDEYEVPGNGTLKQEAAAIMNEVALNHIPVCDMYNTLGWNKYNFKNYFQGSDGTHPRKEAGVMMLAKKILSFIVANNTL